MQYDVVHACPPINQNSETKWTGLYDRYCLPLPLQITSLETALIQELSPFANSQEGSLYYLGNPFKTVGHFALK